MAEFQPQIELPVDAEKIKKEPPKVT